MIDLRKIENALGIALPPHYTSFMQQFEGFSIEDGGLLDSFIYTDADHLIQINQLRRFYLTETPVKHKLIIGDNGGGDYYLIDLQNPLDERVNYFDHEEFEDDVEKESYNSLASFKKEIAELF
jgi:hypothetical protein